MRISTLRLSTTVLLLLSSGCGDPDAFVRAMSRGQAHLENKTSAQAIAAFTEAVERDAASAPAYRNLARAHLLAQDSAAALAALAAAAELEPEAAATSYLTGLAHAREGRFAEARPHLEQAVRLDPQTTALRYQLAAALHRLGELELAAEQLAEALRLDPLHASAHFVLAAVERQLGRPAEAAAHFAQYQRLKEIFGEASRTPSVLEACRHTRAELPVARREPPEPPQSPASPTIRLRATVELLPPGDGTERAAAVLEVDAGGRASFVVAEAGGLLHLFEPRPEGGYERSPIDLPELLPAPAQILVANVHDPAPAARQYDPLRDARNDLLSVGEDGLRLLRARPGGGFEDLTEAAGLGGLRGRRAFWVDLEADGDLDLALAAGAALELWQNNGDGTFVEVAAALGVEHPAPTDVAAADLDGNVALDLVVAGEGSTRIFENLRDGRFRPRPDPPGPLPAARRVLVDDLDNDGRPDVVLLTAGGVLVVPGDGERRRLEAPGLELRGDAPAILELADLDADGWLDVVVAGGRPGGGGAVVVWRNAGSGPWPATAVDDPVDPPRDLLAADLDDDGDTDLLLLGGGGPYLLANESPAAGEHLELRLVGTKTNPTGLGTQVEVRRGRQRIVRTVRRLPIEIGVGDGAGGGGKGGAEGATAALDAVRVVWTNGIVDNQIGVSEKVLTVVEKNVAAGSCPFLYAWDGEGFRFVTDLLGNSPLGLSLRRGVPLDADPDELVEIGPHLPARDGQLVVQVTEEMREVLYLDSVRLLAVDHPPEVEVHPTDKLMPAPFPPSRLQGLVDLRAPVAVSSSDGVERSAALAAIDGVFAPPGLPRPPPLRGQTQPLALTLDFGPLDPGHLEGPAVLALTGWLQYGDASVNIALSQGAAPVVAPRLDAVDAAGRAQELDVAVGMPAGKTKTILVDLEGHLPPGTRQLRLTTTFELRWDRIALGTKVAAAGIQHTLTPAAARLAWRGFSEIRARAPGHPTTPRWAAVRDRPPWRTDLQGWVTRWGDVRELVAERDGRLALVAAGDALELAFDAAELPPVPPDRVRTFFFYSVGWDKDGDPNVIDGDRVGPLPVQAGDDAWLRRYNTRWIPGDRFADRSPSP